MNDKELLRALIEESLISEELSQQITVEASQESKSAEQILYDKNLLDEESVAKAKSKILSIPYKALKPGEILEETLKLIPEETASSYKVVPLELKDKTLIVGMVEPWDNKAQEALRFIAKQKGLNLGVYVITPNDLERVLSRYSPYHTEIERAIKSLNIKPGESVAESLRPVSIDAEAKNLAEEAPIIRIVSSFFFS